MPQTPRFIITIVVSTLAAAMMTYIGVLAYCVVAGVTIQQELMREFSTVGMFVAGVFCGMLTKTSSNPEPSATEQQTITRTTTTDQPSTDDK